VDAGVSIWLQDVLIFVLFLFCYTLGVLRERKRRPKPIPAKTPNLFCGCGDALSYHDGLGPCRKTNYTEIQRKGNGNTSKREYGHVPCGCQQYTGDLPADWYTRDSMRELYSAFPTPQEETTKEGEQQA
jgi:hypothetical protein